MYLINTTDIHNYPCSSKRLLLSHILVQIVFVKSCIEAIAMPIDALFSAV